MANKKDFKEYYRDLSRAERESFAERAGTSTGYIENHLIPRNKSPKRETMEQLAIASRGKLSYKDMVNYFYLGKNAA